MSVAVLRMFHGVMLNAFSPREILGDGNCMYRALSLGLYGTEDNHLYVRLTSMEIIQYPALYDKSNSSTDSFLATMPAPPSSYKSLIKTSLKVGGYSELLHMYAASAAFGIVIQSRNPTCHPAMRLASELILTLDLSSAVVCTGLHCSVSCGQCQQFRVYCSIVYCI